MQRCGIAYGDSLLSLLDWWIPLAAGFYFLEDWRNGRDCVVTARIVFAVYIALVCGSFALQFLALDRIVIGFFFNVL